MDDNRYDGIRCAVLSQPQACVNGAPHSFPPRRSYIARVMNSSDPTWELELAATFGWRTSTVGRRTLA
jgi:hypothetical protein